MEQRSAQDQLQFPDIPGPLVAPELHLTAGVEYRHA
jgi:hypothetical protein